MIELLYFAWVRERIGVGSETRDLPNSVLDVSSLLDWLASLGGGYTIALAERSRIRVAVDQVFAMPETPIRSGAEVAIFPPVTGG